MEKKTVYIPIEIKAREFASQVLLASKIAEGGGRVYLGGKGALFTALKGKPDIAGTLLYKSGWPGGGFAELRKHVSKIAVLDQEMSPVWPNLRPSSRFGADELPLIDRLYYANDGFAQSLLHDRPELDESKVKVLGWPRIDLWHPRYSAFWEADAQKIRQRFGKFVLFSSDFGALHTDELGWRLAKWKENDNWKLRYHSLEEAELDLVARVDEFQKVLGFLARLDENPEFPTVVVRPHPGEDHSRWASALSEMQKTTSVFEGDVSPWLYSSVALLHRGCTTALQAAFNGTPVGWIAAASSAQDLSTSIAWRVSTPIYSVEDAAGLVENNGQTPFFPADSNFIGNLEGNSSDMIADDLLSLTNRPEKKLPRLWRFPGRQRNLFQSARQRAKVAQYSNAFSAAAPTSVTETNLKGGIKAREVRKAVKKLGFTMSQHIKIVQVAKNLVCIEVNRL